MAIDALLQAVLGCANSGMNRFIALMKNHLHVIANHDFFGFDTLFATEYLHFRQWHARRLMRVIVGMRDATEADGVAGERYERNFGDTLEHTLIRMAGFGAQAHPTGTAIEYAIGDNPPSMIAHAHLDVPRGAHVCADMATDAQVVVGVHIAAHG